jgi:hypothetical protein
MAGTVVSTETRSSSIARRNACTSNAGMITDIPATAVSTSSWELQPVTWKSGTEMRVGSCSSRGSARQRRQVSMFDRKFSWVVIAPLGKPVVPLV